jgi:formyl-CoA transferase
LVSDRFAQLTGAEAVALLEAARVAYAHLNSVQGYLSHPVLSGRDRWRTVGTPNGPVRALLPPATMPGVPSRMDPVPALGEHTDAILAELGYTGAEVVRLHKAGAV